METHTILKYAAIGLIAAVATVLVPRFIPGFAGDILAVVMVVVGIVLLMFVKKFTFIGGGVIAAGSLMLGTKYLVPMIPSA